MINYTVELRPEQIQLLDELATAVGIAKARFELAAEAALIGVAPNGDVVEIDRDTCCVVVTVPEEDDESGP